MLFNPSTAWPFLRFQWQPPVPENMDLITSDTDLVGYQLLLQQGHHIQVFDIDPFTGCFHDIHLVSPEASYLLSIQVG